jgi:putative transcriptional regulator
MKDMRKNLINNFEITIGKILVSEPFLLDSYFKRSVILLGEHGEEGTVGFILNKPTDLKLNDALEDFPAFDVPLYFGGPVQTDTIHFLHTVGEKLEGSKRILNGLYWGGDLEELKLMIETNQIDINEIRFFAGYSGWEPNQLEDELKGNTWLVSAGQKDFAFSTHPEELWGQALRKMGSSYAVLANFPEDPSLN